MTSCIDFLRAFFSPLVFRLFLAGGIASALWGCSGGGGGAALPDTEPLSEWTGPFIQRYARDVLLERPAPPVSLTSDDEDWTLRPGESWSARLEIETERYGLARLRLRSEGIERVVLTWTSPYEPEFSTHPGVSIPVVADGAAHEYTVPLNRMVAPSWAGTTNSIGLRAPEGDGDGVVAVLAIEMEAPEDPAPARVTIANETREAVLGTNRTWAVRVPPGGVFETHVGLEPTRRARRTGIRAAFDVYAETENGESVKIASGAVEGKTGQGGAPWRLLRGDLRSFAGQEITLRFEVDQKDQDAGYYPYWGSPMVYSRYGRPGATPVILISCDTARADHFSVYGYPRETSPHLEAFANDAVVFEHAFTEETWTLPSHATMFTGLHPNDHGVTPQAHLAESATTLAEQVSGAGYHSVGYISARLWFLPQRGLQHGFDGWNIPQGGPPFIRDVFDSFGLAEDWIRTRRVNNFFLFAHNMDAHAKPSSALYTFPYGPRYRGDFHFARELGRAPKLHRTGDEALFGWDFMQKVNQGKISLSDYEHEYIVALYDDAIRYIDRGIHELFETLREFDLYDDALIIVTADHGEGMTEHGTYGHDNVFEENARIPFIVKFPGNRFAGTRQEGLVQLHDIMPTVLDALDLPIPSTLTGTSLLRVLEGDAELPPFAFVQRYDQRAVRSADYKYVYWGHRGEGAFYDLSADPLETTDVSEAHETAVARFHVEKERFFEVARPGWHFRVAAPNTAGTLRVNAVAPIEQLHFVRFDRSGDKKPFDVKQFEDAIEITWDAGFQDEIVLRTKPIESPITVGLKLASTLPIRLGEDRAFEEDAFQEELSPSDAGGFRGSDAPEGIEIWFRPEADTVVSSGLTAEEQEELEALGYLGGVQESATASQTEEDETPSESQP